MVYVGSFVHCLTLNPPCANPEPPPCFNSPLYCIACMVWSNVTLKITATIFSCVLNGHQHHSCALWQRHAIHAGTFSWTVMKTESVKSTFSKLNRFWMECLIKTYLSCCTLALYGHVSRILQRTQTKRSRHLYCSGDVRQSTTASCQWLADRHPGCVCCPAALWPPCFFCLSWTLLELVWG